MVRARSPIPLEERRSDLIFVLFFALNLFFITYIVDLEQIVIANPLHFTYPFWPPPPLVNLIHLYGRSLDPLLMARPVWWKATIWIDAVFFGPFYAFAIYAFLRGRDWIRMPSVIWSAVMMTNVTMIMSEEAFGPHATPHLLIVAGLNLPWFVLPIAVIARMYRTEHPFTRPGWAAFRERYGPWALVAGASEGLGAEYARRIAARGLNVALVARREDVLTDLTAQISRDHGVETRVIAQDLAAPDVAERLEAATSDLTVGLAVYNAAFTVTAPYVDLGLPEKLRMLDVNARGPLILTHLFGGRMSQMGRGGIILMSSLAGLQGSPRLATYAATKSYNLVLAEGLWAELGQRGGKSVV